MGIVEKLRVDDSAPLAGKTSREPVSAPATSKLLGLELLRFASAMAVLFYHYNHFAQFPASGPVLRADIPFYWLLWPLYDYGQFGVEIFWGISGYIFFWKYGQAIHAGGVAAARFFWLRFSRLYPLHIATLMLVAGLQIVHRNLTGGDYVFPADDLVHFLGQLLMVNNWGAEPTQSFNGPIWSVSAEVAVYGGFFMLLRKFAPTLKLCAIVLLVGLTLQLGGVHWVPAVCACFFFAGGMAALLPPLAARQRLLAASIAGIIALVAARTGISRDLDLVPWVILGILPFLLAALAGELLIPQKWQRPVEAAGNLTYSTYLLHFPLQLTLAIAVASTGVTPDVTQPMFLVGYLAIALAAGVVSYRALELPAQNWIRKRTMAVRAPA